MELKELIAQIRPASPESSLEAMRRWDNIAKPLGSLGLLEDIITKIAGMRRSADFDIRKKAVVVMCADNGVVAEGVTQTGQDVTAVVTENMSRGDTCVCRFAAVAGADVVPVDIGVARPVEGAKILQRAFRRGTANMTKEPAMSRADCERAIMTGIDIARALAADGYTLLATGEMGIGNTTSSSAVSSVLLGLEPEVVTGRGAGLSTEGLNRKIQAIKSAVALNKPDPSDPIDVLAKVGGLDLAGLCGVFLGGALEGIPVLVDGFISSVAALCAIRLSENVSDYIVTSHVSNEPAGRLMIEALGSPAPIHARLCLGEGTGAVAAMPLLDMAMAVYSEMRSFDEVDIEAYTPKS